MHGGEELQQSSKLSMVSLESTCGNVLDYTVSFYLLQFSLVKELCVDRKDGSLASRLFDCWMCLFTLLELKYWQGPDCFSGKPI